MCCVWNILNVRLILNLIDQIVRRADLIFDSVRPRVQHGALVLRLVGAEVDGNRGDDQRDQDDERNRNDEAQGAAAAANMVNRTGL